MADGKPARRPNPWAMAPSNSALTTLKTYSVRLATGAGFEPAPPACTGALTVELPCNRAFPEAGDGNLDMSDAVGHLAASRMSDAVGYTEGPRRGFRMSDAVGRGVRRGRPVFCFFPADWRAL